MEHLTPWTDATDDDRAAWATYARDLTSTYALVSSTAIASAIILWWPLDYVVGPNAAYVDAFFVLRVGMLTSLAIIVALYRWAPWAHRRALELGVVGYATIMFVIGYSLGLVGGPDLTWLADSFIGILPFAVIPLPFRWRVPASALNGAALAIGFFGFHPEQWSSPYAAGQLSFLVFAVGLSIVAGELILRTVRRSFFQGRSIERQRAGLATLVAERTAELRDLASHLDSVLENERARLSRELHDELGQEITALRLTLDLTESRYDTAPDTLAPLLARLGQLVDRTAGTARRTVLSLRPRVIETLGLGTALEAVFERARQAGLSVSVSTADGCFEGLPDELQHDTFRVVQEAVTNVLRHAHANTLEAHLSRTDSAMVVRITDDGRGFAPDETPRGFGLIGMRERVNSRGGEFTVESRRGGGTTVDVTLPITTGERL